MVGVNRTDGGLNTALWTATGADQWGNIQQWRLANGLITTEYRDIVGRLTSKSTGPSGTATVQNVNYAYTQVGDLASRQDTIDNLTETFNHDNLHRLVQWTRQSPYQTNGSYTVGYGYDGVGNLTYRSDRGCFAYPSGGSTRPHAVATLYSSDCSSTSSAATTTFQYDPNGSLTQIANQGGTLLRTHSWTSFHQPNAISWNTGTPNWVEWLYDSSFNRVKESKLISSGGTWQLEQTIYKLNPGNEPFFEQEVNNGSGSPTENRHYISTPVGIIGMLVTHGEIGSGTTTSNSVMRYWHTDHLGSLTVLTDDSGNVLERFQYDPYGERLDSEGRVVTASRYTDRGFTQHEHIDELNLVHMNGRIFDPITGRFLSADSILQNPGNLQNFNRYSYCVNDPMMCTDPSGHIFGIDDLVFAAIVLASSYGAEQAGWISHSTFNVIAAVTVGWIAGPAGYWGSWVGGSTLATSMTAGFAAGVAGSGGSLQAGLYGALSAGAFSLAGGVGFTYGGDSVAAYGAQAAAGCMSGETTPALVSVLSYPCSELLRQL